MSKKTSEFLSALGVQFEIWKALVQAVLGAGGTDEHLRRIITDKKLQGKLAELIVGAGTSVPTFTYDKTKDGWKLAENITEPKEFSIKDLQLVPFLRGGESYINGEEMVRRAIKMKCNLGQQHAEYLLANQDQIPTEFRKHYLVFPGTVWQFQDGYRSVPCLRWRGDRWFLNFDWLDFDWLGRVRLLSARKPA